MAATVWQHRLAVWTGVLVYVTACGSLATEPPSRDPALTGTITVVEARSGVGLDPVSGIRILVEEDPGVFRISPPQSKKSYFFVSDELTTVFIRKPDGGWKRVGVDSLEVGQLVTGWYVEGGLVLTSYPGQGTASEIAILLNPG